MAVRMLVGHVLDQLAELPEESVHCVIADPPYGETSLEWDTRVDGWLQAISRVMRREASLWCFGSMRFFMQTDFSGWRLAQDIVWEKHNGTSLFNDRFRRVHELICQFYPCSVPWSEIYKNPITTNDAVARTVRKKGRPAQWIGATGQTVYRSKDGGPRLMRSVLYARSEHSRAQHPTQKPLAILLPLIEYSCPPGGTVLDLFSGSGSAAVAAQRLNRDSVGIEISQAYAELAERRIRDDLGLFSAVAD